VLKGWLHDRREKAKISYYWQVDSEGFWALTAKRQSYRLARFSFAGAA